MDVAVGNVTDAGEGIGVDGDFAIGNVCDYAVTIFTMKAETTRMTLAVA